MSELSEGLLFGLGNPLLDIICTVDEDFLAKYGLSANNAILAEERHKDLSADMIAQYPTVLYLAGGAVQNTLRVAQWMLGSDRSTTFMGAIGADDFGQRMSDKAREDGVNAVYMVDSTTSTGTCAVMVTDNGKSRSLCAYLGASQKFNIEHLLKNYELVEKARVFYTSGFHLVVSPDSILNIAKHAQKSDHKLFCLNLSAPYISQFYSEPLLQVLPFVDILFGNETEAQAFADLNQWKTKDLKEISKLIADMECLRKDGRTVVITQGKDNVLVAFTDKEEVKEFAVTQLEDHKLVDTNGAGDAFVGGFFAQLIRKKPLEDCIRSAIYAATEVIQLSGCAFPQHNHFQ